MEPYDALSVCAEIAIAITGFSGVVLVFGENNGAVWSEVDKIRFRMLFTGSLTSLGLIAIAFILDAAESNPASTWLVCSIAYFMAASTTAYFNTRAAARADINDPNLQIPRFANIWRGGAIALTCAIVIQALQLANAILWQSFWPILVAAWWGIALSLFSFVGLIFSTRAA